MGRLVNARFKKGWNDAAIDIKRELWAMRRTEYETRTATDTAAKEYIYGYTECINDVISHINKQNSSLWEKPS